MEYSVANTDEIDSVVPEEVYLVVDGEVTVRLAGTETEPEIEETLDAGQAIRVAPETRRQLPVTAREPRPFGEGRVFRRSVGTED